MKKLLKKPNTPKRIVKLNFIFHIPVKGLDKKKLKTYLLIAANQLSLSGIFNVVFCDPQLAGKLNLKFRKKNYPPDILTFWYEDQKEADIIINTRFLEKDPNTTCLRLGVHGLVHLTGLDHEVPEQQDSFFRLEQKVLNYLQVKAASTLPT